MMQSLFKAAEILKKQQLSRRLVDETLHHFTSEQTTNGIPSCTPVFNIELASRPRVETARNADFGWRPRARVSTILKTRDKKGGRNVCPTVRTCVWWCKVSSTNRSEEQSLWTNKEPIRTRPTPPKLIYVTHPYYQAS